ncbi:MAG: penicillin acylase family protein, partial [Gammaproteobacteria bacterium]|nr:penicillin acylase family protein [Gammaproteobacteria bacterium]
AKLVKRPEHVNSSVILDGASGNDDPLGFYDFSHNPQILNPESGALYTSNNQPSDTGIGLIPGYYVPRDRAERISGYLYSEENQWDAEKMKAMLMDNTSPLVAKFQGVMTPILSKALIVESDTSQTAFAIFKDWQGNHDPDQVAASMFYQFKKELLQRTFKDEMGKHDYGVFEEGFLRHKTLWKMLGNKASPWWDDVTTEAKVESRADIIITSWLAMISTLEAKFGTNIDNWQWKKSLVLEHSHPLGNVKPLNLLFNIGPFEAAGGNETINNMIFRISDEEFTASFGPSTRRIVDFGEIDKSWGINPTGQSGVVMDKHYGDQGEMYSKGEFRHQYTKKSDIIAHKEGLLTLNPE